jgi:DNA (cytosine-5)-methyltransferase 1
MVLKVFDMFAGYGGAEFSLKKAGIEHKCIGFSEIDKYAVQCFEQNHKGVKNYGDCTKIDLKYLPDFDLLCGGFPCQDVSIAGNRDLSKGRTNLYKEVLRIADAKKPKYMLLENVKGLLSINKDRNLRDIIINDLKKIGYDVCFKCLNSKDYGIPQNRERVWFVCKLGKWQFGEFMFPVPTDKNKLTLKDILLEEVEDKYYLTESQIKTLQRNFGAKGKPLELNKPSQTLSAAMGTGGGNVPFITNKSPRECGWHKERTDEIPTIKNSYRKLTPRECFRLMGFLNDEINLDNLSDSQLYKLAGNGWEINIVSLILKQMFRVLCRAM